MPERNIAGMIVICVIIWKLSTDCTFEAMTMPTDDIAMARTSISTQSSRTIGTVKSTPITGMSRNNTEACATAIDAPPSNLPMPIAVRLIGATSISRRKPNSRSQMIVMPANTEFIITIIATTPG